MAPPSFDDQLSQILSRPGHVAVDFWIVHVGAEAVRQRDVGVGHAPLVVLQRELLVVRRIGRRSNGADAGLDVRIDGIEMDAPD